MEAILAYRQQLADFIDRYLEGGRGSNTINRWHDDLLKRLGQFVTTGKLLRGGLACFSHAAFGGQTESAAVRVGAALEITHAGLLIHDDVMDESNLRRGQPAVHHQYADLAAGELLSGTRKFGENMAICVADAALFMPLDLLSSLSIPARAKARLLELFGTTLTTVCCGQMSDIYLSSYPGPIYKKSIFTVMRQKTAGYSVALPLAAGAILAGQPEKIVATLIELGNHVGIIFQIRDDELDIFGDTERLGKEIGSDITSNKKTLLYYYLHKLCPTEEQRRISTLFGKKKIRPVDISYLRDLIERSRVRDRLDREINQLARQAKQLVMQLPIEQKHTATLDAVVEFCSRRES